MNGSAILTTLALGFNDLVFYAFLGLFVVGPWIAKVLKQAGQQPNAPKGRKRPAVSKRPQGDPLAGQRRGPITPRPTPTGRAEPANLTMAQRVERARARAVYNQRSRQLQHPPPGARQTVSLPLEAPPPTQQPRPTRQEQPARQPSLRQQLETEHAQGVVHRHVPDAHSPAREATPAKPLDISGQALRRAIVLKEILDRPVALRDSSANDPRGV